MAEQQQFYYARVFGNKFCCFSGSPDNYDPNLDALGIYTSELLPDNAQVAYGKPYHLTAKVKVKVRRTREDGTKYLTCVSVRVSNDKLGSILTNPQQLTFPNCVVLNKAFIAVRKSR